MMLFPNWIHSEARSRRLHIALGVLLGWATATVQAADIVGTIEQAGRFDTLAKAIEAAGLSGTLKEQGPFTVFAPTDEAIERLPPGTLDQLLKEESRQQLETLLKQHIVRGHAIPSDQFPKQLDPLAGSPITISFSEGRLMLRSGEDQQALVLQGDLRADNGIIHAIDTILLPQQVAQAAQAKEAPEGTAKKEQLVEKMQGLAPARGYLDAHKNEQKPLDLLGGPIKVHIRQDSGGVFVGLPDHRKLDRHVFGMPELPRAYGGTPVINGLPPMLREQANGEYTVSKPLTPFGDKHMVMGNGKLTIEATDATATDAATTKDKLQMNASWDDEAGNTYTVKCCAQLATHGIEYPTFGGVMTNHILHGFTRIGTALMPTEFSYFAFWGMGQVEKNGEVVDKSRLVHGMLTEYVRTEGYALGFDEDVTPTRRHFHLMVPPMKPVPEQGVFAHAPLKTGFDLPNGKELPFWHVMFENLQIEASRGE